MQQVPAIIQLIGVILVIVALGALLGGWGVVLGLGGVAYLVGDALATPTE